MASYPLPASDPRSVGAGSGNGSITRSHANAGKGSSRTPFEDEGPWIPGGEDLDSATESRADPTGDTTGRTESQSEAEPEGP